MQRTITKKQYDSLSVMAHQASGTYCYHSDHLGSATWITTKTGQPVEYLHYLPYGELWRDQRTTSYSERFRFTGKERDTETGYDYFGARYYSSTLPTWLSVDPLSDKYPNISPYAYCNWNPINATDLDGREWKDVEGNTIADHSKIQAYIYYNPDDFKSQAYNRAVQLEMKYGRGSVAMSDVITNDEFAADWKAMSSDHILEVDIDHHGSNQAIHLDWKNKQYITSTGTGHTQDGVNAKNISELGTPVGNISNAILYLNTCHSNNKGNWLGNIRIYGNRILGTSGTLVGTKETLMQSFWNNFNFNAIRGTSAGVSYDRYMQPEPQFFFQSWTYFNRH